MNKYFFSCITIAAAFVSPFLLAEEAEEQKAFAIAPIISSSPNMGTGLGVTSSYLYKTDEHNPTSQLMGFAQYTDTDSFSIGGRNMMHFDDGKQRAVSAAWMLHINNDFNGAEFTSEMYGLFHRHSWEVAENWFAGIQGIGMFNNYTANNQAGGDFLARTGAEDNRVFGFGFNAMYDTRDNFYYPMQGSIFEANTLTYLESLGSDEDYNTLELKYSHYITVRDKDVVALGYYGRYVSDETPYSGESYLGRRSALRGFNVGEISGQRLSAVQAEYRYHISEKWKFVGFAGMANIQGGTAQESNREGLYYSAGLGVRYALQPKDKVHLRFDVAVGNDDNQGFYIGLQEAF
ncbi:BamA/TamA family outer membrane protein [Thalassotalea sp. LPB0316]|uniref:BamA/TamA family outer membrane protein n=1 Tax=Thalassotalea sp. LPB0316 TaxID=2769490 RepID=UPI0018676F67|nr:BamA/TamA family outer membrane protein [Thalassotalea sp. LPB0316]QOL25760.1 BamA/TamA family outer membrane protein [Thalassotalea sp. LPB0316]